MKIGGVNALSSLLTDAKLLGTGAIKFGSPDLIILNSGGPATHLAENSILCGPANMRVVIRQPEGMPVTEPNNALEGKLELLSETPTLTAELEEWKHGCWYHSNIISAAGLGDLMNKLKQITPELKFHTEHRGLPKGAFWTGSVAYDMIQWTQPIALTKQPDNNAILAVLWLIEDFIVHNNTTGAFSVYGSNKDWTEGVNSILSANKKIEIELTEQPENNHQEISSISDQQHLDKIGQITEAIAKGMFYQINFGRFWRGKLVEHPLKIFHRLTVTNPAPFSAYIEAVDLGLAIVSSSPETLLRCNSGILSTAPIKGTVTRGANKSADLGMIASMIADVKERSEHRMLVDLMRNDLSIVSEVGTVNVSRFNVESYANVHHLVSHITGELSSEYTSSDAFDAVFPGGSITGCPRTMVSAAIDQIELTNRSFWTGSVGWFDPFSNDCSWNILIRTLEARKRGKSWSGVVGAGGGITIRSEPEMEVAEAVWKSQAIRKACGWLKPEFDVTNTGALEVTELPIENQFNFSQCGEINMVTESQNDDTIRNSVLIIDNLDSFTLNIANVVAGLGHNVCIVNGRNQISEHYALSGNLAKLLSNNPPSHIILGPGPGVPEDSKLTMAIANLAVAGELSVPLFGICLGHQAIGVSDGYELIQDPNGAIHGTPVVCQSDGTGLFVKQQESDLYVRYNSLLITGNGSGQFTANTFDEYGSIMGLRHKSLPIHSVQFHPESVGSENGIGIIKAFLGLKSDA